MTSTNALDLFHAGKLKEALAAATDAVRQHPADAAAREFLGQLLCFTGDFERADRQLDALAQQDPGVAVGVALFRSLLRGEQARQQFFSEGRLPDFLDAPSERMRLHLEASIRLRDNQPEEAARLLEQAEEQRPNLTGACDGQPFEGLRDTDDLTASFFKVLASSGKYYWIPMERVESIEFRRIAGRSIFSGGRRTWSSATGRRRRLPPRTVRRHVRRTRRPPPSGPVDRMAGRSSAGGARRRATHVPGRRRGPVHPGHAEADHPGALMADLPSACGSGFRS